MGLRGAAAERFGKGAGGSDAMVAYIEDVTPLFCAVGEKLRAGDTAGAAALLPKESAYSLPPNCAISQAAAGRAAGAAAAAPEHLEPSV